MNEDLARERASTFIDVEALTHLIDGGAAATSRRRELQAIVEGDPVFAVSDNIFMSRPEKYRHGLRKSCAFNALIDRLKLCPTDRDVLCESLSDTLPMFLHSLMFTPNIEALCTEAQRQHWLPLCRSNEVIGCYAQTELGHGSNIRALETTATFIRETDEFDIHTPSITATKWWPGTLGRTANHAMVIAQLVIDGKVYGIHNFIVPIRGEDHLPLPGVRVGDIGPKIGFNAMDNGYCSFDHVRIPRLNMAMRHQQVDRNGVYRRTASKEINKIAYITVTQVRAYIAYQAGKALAKAATIATRYSILRRQGFRDESEGPGEQQILDYTIQMHRLLPNVAAAFGFHFTGQAILARLRKMERVYIDGEDGIAAESLKHFHAATSSLKSMCTSVTAAGIEDCRRACGGHGFLQSSGLPEHLNTYLQACTVEGENHMLTQQVVRILLQELSAARRGEYVGTDCTYMSRLLEDRANKNRCPATRPQDLRCGGMLEAALEHRAFRLLTVVEARLAKDIMAGMSPSKAWNRALVEIYRASFAHAYLLVFKGFKAVVDTRGALPDQQQQPLPRPLDGATGRALDLLLTLLGLHWLQNEMGDFVEDGYLSCEQAGWVREEVVEVLHLLRPMAISLVDAWDFSDFQLNSALGRYDGRVYEALLETTKQNPMNKREPVEGYEEHIEPVIRAAREARLTALEARAKGSGDEELRDAVGSSPRSKL